MTLVRKADLGTRDELELGLAYALSQQRKALVVEVSDLEFCDSRCATALIDANCNAPGTEMVLMGKQRHRQPGLRPARPGMDLARHR
jgi:anti-anti-sigma regulatory factor